MNTENGLASRVGKLEKSMRPDGEQFIMMLSMWGVGWRLKPLDDPERSVLNDGRSFYLCKKVTDGAVIIGNEIAPKEVLEIWPRLPEWARAEGVLEDARLCAEADVDMDVAQKAAADEYHRKNDGIGGSKMAGESS